MQTSTNFLTDRQVAARYGVSRTSIWHWVKHNPGFPSPVKLSPGFNRWRVADLEAWETSRAECA